jgi:hypothetical protein
VARSNNFLLGNGERLTSRVNVPTGGGDKNPPYTFEGARQRMTTRLRDTVRVLDATPSDAAPNDEVVAVVTMHPRYVSKSDFPQELLTTVGLRPVGSRSLIITPESWGIEKHPKAAVTEQLFVAGKKSTFERWANQIGTWTPQTRGAQQILHFENVSAFSAADKLRSIPTERDSHGVLEVVLHNAGDQKIVDAFLDYARRHNTQPIADHRRDVKGLTFIPVETDFERAEELARFSFVRVARPLPTLRLLRPVSLARSVSTEVVEMPDSGPVDGSFRALVFDGGLPNSAVSTLNRWVNYVEPAGIGPAVPIMQDHGLAVTAAFLFGPLKHVGRLPTPACGVDHVRVIDSQTAGGPDLQYIDVLDRILAYMDSHSNQYEFINVSLGPNMPLSDDEITSWTASLDDRLSSGRAVATFAAGNDGERDATAGLNRVQPPADAVNALAVGAADASGAPWVRAAYSCVGPGRSPGYVKPDGVAFGGSQGEPFITLGIQGALVRVSQEGTSLASPYALRSAAAVRAQLGRGLSPLAIRALLIHRADPGAHAKENVGWGRFEADPERLITCEDDEALVIYQGSLPVGEHLRAVVPLPDSGLSGMVHLTATLVIGPEVDPEHPGAYTRSGLEVAFRPNSTRFTKREDGTRSAHPKTRSFFSPGNLYGSGEFVLRDEGYKWEPCLRNSQQFRATTLHKPCFDIYYHHRASATKASLPQPIPYAFVVSMRAPRVQDLYNRVVRTYAKILVPLRPQLRIPVRT